MKLETYTLRQGFGFALLGLLTPVAHRIRERG